MPTVQNKATRSSPIDPQDANGVHPRNTLNDLTAREWIPETVSVWVQRGLGREHPHAQIEREHPAPFSYQDVSRLIRFFSKSGQRVLDPFVGVGSTLKAAALEGRLGVGIELNPKYASLAERRLREEVPRNILSQHPQKVMRGDARKVLAKLEPDSFDLVVTSPPYWNILHKKDHKAEQEREAFGLDTKYSEHRADLGNVADYNEFVQELGGVFKLCHAALKDRGYLCVIVGDFRHKSKYFMFHADLARQLEEIGYVVKGMHILYQKHKRIFPYGYPAAFVPNLHHQFIIILRKNS